ncbi:MAG: DUF2235 domain-containing protein, partial [Candidatus Thiodiazotropha sp. (ex Ustalcina ferruginea)]|nr:DUF2235 domain-containing protein [Candidatus Thiodiazotropha sp. (ex Ustalcina ferruginea)]
GARHGGSTVSPHGCRGLTASAFSLPWRSANDKRTTAPGLSFHVGEKPPKIVSVARQALAIDERRTDFRPEIWQGAHPDQSVEQRSSCSHTTTPIDRRTCWH